MATLKLVSTWMCQNIKNTSVCWYQEYPFFVLQNFTDWDWNPTSPRVGKCGLPGKKKQTALDWNSQSIWGEPHGKNTFACRFPTRKNTIFWFHWISSHPTWISSAGLSGPCCWSGLKRRSKQQWVELAKRPGGLENSRLIKPLFLGKASKNLDIA